MGLSGPVDRDNIIIAGHTNKCHCLVNGELPSLLVVHTPRVELPDDSIFSQEDD